MRYRVLATDYDGTLAHHGRVDDEAVAALERLRDSGRRAVLVTGRELPDLRAVFARLDLFDYVAGENGALLYQPATGETALLCERVAPGFVEELRRQNVTPLSVGQVIVATREEQREAVLEAMERLGLRLQVVLNKGAVMVLPEGVNKATGLAAALRALGLSFRHAVAIGDAENDLELLASCDCAVAVANALAAVKEQADFVTSGDHGRGVAEAIDRLIERDGMR